MLKRSADTGLEIQFSTAILVVTFVFVSLNSALAADSPVIPGFERFHSENPGVDGGRLLINELNCASCHQELAADGSVLAARKAPILSDVGSRVHRDYLKKFIADPHQVKPGTTMPNLFAGMSDQEKTASVESLVQFLASTGVVSQLPPNKSVVKRGETLFHTVGCVACHNSRKDGAKQLSNSVPLVGLEKKYTVGSLTSFLKNPHAVRPSGRMPNLNLSDQETLAIASYFLKDVEVPANVNYAYYEGKWQKLPDFSQLTPKTTGGSAGIGLNVRERNDGFGIVFDGYLNVPAAGKATIILGSDDGSRVLIDGKEILRNDGVHPYSKKDARIDMTAGVHHVVVEYFEGGGEEVLTVDYKFKRNPPQPLGNLLTKDEAGNSARVQSDFVLDSEKVAKGRQLFASLGCASCHEMKVDDQPIVAKLSSPAAQGTAGCLAADAAGSGKAPHFALSSSQQKAITAAIGGGSSPTTDSASTIAFTMASLNCYACHSRDKIGGPERVRDAAFTSTIPEMGDEGRVPPPLDGVGDKLNDVWLKHVMDNGANDRPYMKTRMPKFGQANVGKITEAFAKLDRKTESPDVKFDVAMHRIQSAGRKMVGDKGGLACVKCHYFGKFKATGIQAMDLQTMTKRLRKDWFQRYLINPQDFRPGTRMPTGFPARQSVVPDVLEGEMEPQIAAIWTYLEAGSKARMPSGLSGGMIELVAKDEPIIYRNFIEGLSPRGIAVGYPEQAHLAWDAEQFSIALIWHGGFMDASRHWNGRGQGRQPPLGDHLMPMVKGQPFAKLPSGDSDWPKEQPRKAGFRFKGYQLDGRGRPTFKYSMGSIVVEDFAKPVPAKPDASFKRTLSLSGGEGTVYFRAAKSNNIEKTADGYLVDKAVTLGFTVEGGGQPVIREKDGMKELLVPIVFSGDKATLVETIVW